jgi:hypothetical protein
VVDGATVVVDGVVVEVGGMLVAVVAGLVVTGPIVSGSDAVGVESVEDPAVAQAVNIKAMTTAEILMRVKRRIGSKQFPIWRRPFVMCPLVERPFP